MPSEQSSAEQLVGEWCTDWKAEQLDGENLKILGAYTFPNEFHGFSGHFPDRPILPAVIQLAAVRCLVERCVDYPGTLRKLERTRFKAVVVPGQPIFVAVNLEKIDDGWRCSFSLTGKTGDVFASGTMELAI